MSNKKNRIWKAMETVLKAFENNPEKVALAVFKVSGKPSDAWSFFKRLIMLMTQKMQEVSGSGKRSAEELKGGKGILHPRSHQKESTRENQERSRKDKRERRNRNR